MFPYEQQQAAPAVEIAPVEAYVGPIAPRAVSSIFKFYQYVMQGEPSLKNSSSFAPPTIVAPAIVFPRRVCGA